VAAQFETYLRAHFDARNQAGKAAAIPAANDVNDASDASSDDLSAALA
jgi:UTP--glucose-1-phosphate uridylyltransferase